MSLTSFLRNPDVKEKFRKTFTKPNDLATLRPVHKILYKPLLPLTKRYSLIGTAFDYLMRFYLKRLNPIAITQSWVAEASLQLTRPGTALNKKAKHMIKQAQNHYTAYLKTGKLTDSLVKSALLLAQLDVIYRASIVPDDLGRTYKKDITDLKGLINLVNGDKFVAKKVCLLNPTFGEASLLVGGADADLVLDDMIVDIKTTKNLRLTRQDFNQLVGYFSLYKIGKIDGSPRHYAIRRVGIYFSRFGYLYQMDVDSFIEQKPFLRFLKWFKRRASSEFGWIPQVGSSRKGTKNRS